MTRLSLRRPLYYGLGLSVLWALLALVRPAVTFHLAPALVAASVPWIFVAGHQAAADRRDRLVAVAIGLGLSLSVTTVLQVAGLLSGPSLLPVGGAVFESYVGALLGGLLGLGSLFWQRPAPA